jgi:hypothetical protein
MKPIFGAIVIVAHYAFAACGSSNDAALIGIACSGDCECTGSTCSCEKGGTCVLGGAPTAADAGADGAVAPASGVAPSNVTYHCDSQNDCDLTCGTGCTNTCAGQSECAGTCGSNCTSSCTGTSTCTLVTGVDSEVTCGGGSDCAITLDTGSKLSCQGDSTCTIKCPKGGCTADCTGSAACRVECGEGAPCHIECNGQRAEDCAAGMTCNGSCGGSSVPDAGMPTDVPDAGPPMR